MATEYLTSTSPGSSNIVKTLEVANGVTGDWIIFPNDMREIGVDLIPSGTAKIQTSNDIDGIKAGTVTAIDWDDGEITTPLGRTCIGVRAMRLVSISGAAKAYIDGVIN